MTRPPRSPISIRFLLGIFLTAAPGGTAWAGPVTWDFEGVVETVFDENSVLGGTAQPGSLITGSITFESTTHGDGLYYDPFTSVFGAIDEFAFEGPLSDIGTIHVLDNSSPGMNHDALGFVIPLSFASADAGLSLSVVDPSGLMFDSTELPLVPPNIDALSSDLVRFSLARVTEDLAIRGRLTALVPEPGTFVFMMVIVFAVVYQRKTGRSRRPRHPNARVVSLLIGAVFLICFTQNETVCFFE